jgi:hypothetical protein
MKPAFYRAAWRAAFSLDAAQHFAANAWSPHPAIPAAGSVFPEGPVRALQGNSRLGRRSEPPRTMLPAV